MGEERRRRAEQVALIVLFGGAALFFVCVRGDLELGLACALIAGLNLPLTLLWGLFLTSFVGGLLCALLSVLWVIPLQLLPVPPPHSNGVVNGSGSFWSLGNLAFMRIAAAGLVGAIACHLLFFPAASGGTTFTLMLLAGSIFAGLCHFALKLRVFIKDNVVTRLLLPALKVMEMPLMNGQYSYVQDLVEAIRSQMLCTTELVVDEEASSTDGVLWTNVQIPGPECVIDAAYLRHPAQQALSPPQQRWVLWFNGNGELYEFLLPELQTFAARSGLNVFAFNFRGVGMSTGMPHAAEDLVADGALCLRYITDHLGALPEQVLLYGHSLGGAIAPLVRADTSPLGPVVSERSFCSLAAAAQSVLAMITASVTGANISLPQALVQGMLNSVFKGHLNVVAAWRAVSGPRLIIYTTRDAIIPYKTASLHQAVLKDPATEAQSIGLGSLGNADHHNSPLQKFPEYERVLSRCREMLGLSPDLPPPCPSLAPRHDHPARPLSMAQTLAARQGGNGHTH